MNETVSSILAIAELVIYTGLIRKKAREIRKARDTAQTSSLRFDLYRLATDCLILTIFLLSGLWSAYLRLFSPTPFGVCTGCLALVFLSLVLSVAVDWIYLKRCCRKAGNKRPSFLEFLQSQLIGILRIDCALALIGIVFMATEKTGTALPIRIAAAAAAVLVYAAVPRILRQIRKDRTN